MKLAILLCFCLAGWAQQENPEMKLDVQNLPCPSAAATARIEGIVAYEVSDSKQKLVADNPFLEQGLFLYPIRGSYDFELALKRTLHSFYNRHDTGTCDDCIYKLTIEPGTKLGVLKELNRMNVTSTSLFPALEGFARSVR